MPTGGSNPSPTTIFKSINITNILMQEIIQRIDDDYQSRLSGFKKRLEEHKDWKVFTRVLMLSSQSCFNIFRQTNDSLEDCENLHSLLVNGLLDDSTLEIKVTGKDMFTFLYVGWGNDDSEPVSEKDLLHLIDLEEASKSFYDLYKKELDDDMDRNKAREYFALRKNVMEYMLSLADENTRRYYLEEKEKGRKKFDFKNRIKH